MNAPRPFYKNLTNEGLVEAYKGLKVLADEAAKIRSPKLRQLLREMNIVVSFAQERGLTFPE